MQIDLDEVTAQRDRARSEEALITHKMAVLHQANKRLSKLVQPHWECKVVRAGVCCHLQVLVEHLVVGARGLRGQGALPEHAPRAGDHAGSPQLAPRPAGAKRASLSMLPSTSSVGAHNDSTAVLPACRVQ
jgi:hypothetical protein